VNVSATVISTPPHNGMLQKKKLFTAGGLVVRLKQGDIDWILTYTLLERM
jgi:hypothetical protein